MILNDFTEPRIRFSREKLDAVLENLCQRVIEGQQKNPDFYGMVAAAVIDPKGQLVTGINYLYGNGRVHAENDAIDRYEEQYGELPRGSIIVTTLSPCSEDTHDNRHGKSCTALLNSNHIRLAYCGYKDPTQADRNKFVMLVTENETLHEMCKDFADTFLAPEELDENFADGKQNIIWEDEHDPEVEEWQTEDVRQRLLAMPHLFENDDRYTGLRDFLNRHDTVVPKAGKSYSIATIKAIPLGNIISLAQTNTDKLLLDTTATDYVFDFGNRTRTIPKSKFNGSDLLSYTILFDNPKDLEQFVNLLLLKYSDWKPMTKSLLEKYQSTTENFADGKGPGRPGDSQRHGIPKGATIAQLEKASHAKGRKGQLARWQLNMRRGKKK